MCDYSLMGLPNRLAREDEELVLHRFQTGSMGLVSPRDLDRIPISEKSGRRAFWARMKTFLTLPQETTAPAVCIPPDAYLRLMDIPPDLQRDLGVGPTEHVVFTQLSAAVNTYRDAIRFSNGREILLQRLREGQRVTVLSLEPFLTGQTAESKHIRFRQGRSEHLPFY